jgi:glycosyltransferase involved in cell wall biosynthesis
MKIAFDGRAAQKPPHSYRRLLDMLLMGSQEIGADIEMWTDGDLHPECLPYSSFTRPFPTETGQTDADLVWTPTPSVVAGGNALSISTVCDVNPLLPDGRNVLSRWRRAKRFRQRVTTLGESSWRVATDSEDARQRLAEAFPDLADKLRVIPLYAPPSLGRIPDDQRDPLLAELDLKPGYLFFVGSFRRHKNWHGLMQAYAMCPKAFQQRYPLVFAGPVHRDRAQAERLMAKLGITATTRVLGETAERHMAALYSGASLFVFPTFMEGFGLPPLEAMQCGVPVIATNRTAVPEVLGDAACYIDPANLSDLASAMQHVLASPEKQASMVRDGLARAQQFSAKRTGAAIQQLLEEKQKAHP